MSKPTLSLAAHVEILAIAVEHFRVETLETRRSDSLDFHDIAVWCMRDALAAAYLAGMVDHYRDVGRKAGAATPANAGQPPKKSLDQQLDEYLADYCTRVPGFRFDKISRRHYAGMARDALFQRYETVLGCMPDELLHAIGFNGLDLPAAIKRIQR